MLARIRTFIRWRCLKPKPPRITENTFRIVGLGSKYGRKYFSEEILPKTDICLVSAGVGEDMSFDVEMMRIYEGHTYLVDPTEVSISHFKEVSRRWKMDRETNYGNASSQRIDSYPLEGITGSRFTYVPVALWKSRGKIHFFPPKEGSRDPSYSINAISSFYKRETIPTEVETETIKGLIEIYKIPEIHLLKLDIEGAALEVLKQMFKDLILPDQILLEIDEMHFPSLKSNFRTRKLLAQLKINGYLCIKQDNCDFTFIQKKFISK